LLFFGVILLFLLYITYKEMRTEEQNLKSRLFLEMKNFALGAEDTRFATKVIDHNSSQKLYKLHEDRQGLYILVPHTDIPQKELTMIVGPVGNIVVPYTSNIPTVKKIWYPKEAYRSQIGQLQQRLAKQLILFVIGAIILSLLAAWYTLRPLRESARRMEEFIKDIIHDLNTPLTSILLNLKMIDKQSEEIESIHTSAQTIQMLHHNLDAYLKEQTATEEIVDVGEVVDHYVRFFTPLYDYLEWDVRQERCRVHTDRKAFERIVYNLLSNACKYNTTEGKIKIILTPDRLTITNNSYGVKHPERVFERFYKESDRGLGIGLHIVDKLCHTLGIEKQFTQQDNLVTVTLRFPKEMQA